MELEILCTTEFQPDECSAIDMAAARLGVTQEEVIRMAVKNFAAQCVPTQKSDGNGRAA